MLVPRPLLVGTAVVLIGGFIAGCSGGSPSSDSRSGVHAVTVSVSQCGVGWRTTSAGPQRITLHNSDSRPGEAQLINPDDGAVFADVEPFGPDTTVSIEVDLAAGTYAWRCLMEDEAAVVGPTQRITGRAQGAVTPGVRPVSQADLIPSTQAYQHYVAGQLPGLATQVAALRQDLRRGDLAAAEQDWLAGHLRYETLGAAYDAFGDLDGAINGLPNGLPGGVHDGHWTGFHRIEYGLWHGQSAASLLPLADELVRDVAQLQRHFATAQVDPLTITTRAHEISENTLQLSLTGADDFGSHSERQTIRANLLGTQVVLGIIHPLIAPRYPGLGRATVQLQNSLHDLAVGAGHERLDADLSELCELLAPIAEILEPRKTS